MQTLKLTLDWTPNTNHTGFYVGVHKGWFKEAGIDLQILSPSDDYSKDETPARRVVKGIADLCIAPSESVISCWTSEPDKTRPVAVATILQNDTSSIVSLKSGPVQSIKDLDDRRYASYDGRFEMAIIKQAIKNEGGKGSVIELVPPKLNCFELVLNGEAEATWIFNAWEGLQAQRNGHQLNIFPLKDSKVPYGYTPILLAHPSLLQEEKADLLRRFLQVTTKSYQYCVSNPEDAAKCLLDESQHHTLKEFGLDFLIASQSMLSTGHHIVNNQGQWGVMDGQVWTNFLDWLCEHNCLTDRQGNKIPRESLKTELLFTNDFLPK